MNEEKKYRDYSSFLNKKWKAKKVVDTDGSKKPDRKSSLQLFLKTQQSVTFQKRYQFIVWNMW